MMLKRYSMMIAASALGLSLLGYQLWHDDKPMQPDISTKTEGEATRSQRALSEELEAPLSQPDQYTSVGDSRFSEGGNDKSSTFSSKKQPHTKQSQAEKLDRLIELDIEIDQQNEELAGLIKEYDKYLSNKQNHNQLSSALQNSEAYKSNLLDKFKIESDNIVAEN